MWVILWIKLISSFYYLVFLWHLRTSLKVWRWAAHLPWKTILTEWRVKSSTTRSSPGSRDTLNVWPAREERWVYPHGADRWKTDDVYRILRQCRRTSDPEITTGISSRPRTSTHSTSGGWSRSQALQQEVTSCLARINHPNSPNTDSLTLWMKTLLSNRSPPSTNMKLSYLPVSPIWVSLMIREQSPDPSFSSGTSTRPSYSAACHLLSPRCSNTVSAGVFHWMWPRGCFQLQGRTTCSPTLDWMDWRWVWQNSGEESGGRGKSLRK